MEPLLAILEPLPTALERVLSPQVLAVMLVAAAAGVMIGAIPGLTATMAVALVVPFTFFLDDVSAIAAIVTLVTCSIFAGDIPTTLVRIPGTPASAAYADDAYALTRSGRHRQALRIALFSSVFGGLFGAVVLITAAPQLAKVAILFTTYEDFWLVVLGLSCAALISSGSRVKGTISLVLGLLVATVGLSEVHAAPRFTFGQDEVLGGINFIPAMIGLFGGSVVLRNMLRGGLDRSLMDEGSAVSLARSSPLPEGEGTAARAEDGELSDTASVPARVWRQLRRTARSGSIGALIGMLPGAGADIAAWVSYAVSKRFSRQPERYGHGSTEGIADATGANNSALAGAWIPALVFGIPGDSVAAIVIGVLMMKNITPGPNIFQDQGPLVWSIYLVFILANLILLPVGLLAIRGSSLLLRLRRGLLFPGIVLVSIVGSYAINGSYFDVGVMLVMSVVGLALEGFRVPLGPMVLGIILGGKLEQTFIQNLAKSDSLLAFFGIEHLETGLAVDRPLALMLGVGCLALWLLPILLTRLRRGVSR